MTIKYTNDLAIFEGACKLNEAEPLYEWLKQTPVGKLDLTDCKHIHTAIMQVILLAKPPVVAGPADDFLKHWFANIRVDNVVNAEEELVEIKAKRVYNNLL